ncbi:MAG: hypothetical protein WCB67_05280 [Solirubrobacteraceae bacterium]
MLLRRQAKLAVLAVLAVFAAGVLSAGPALAKNASNPVINDCLAHRAGLTGHYTVAQLNHALQVMSAETKEYTNCPDVINRALLAAVGHGGSSGGGGGGGSFLPTPVIIILVVLVLAAVTFGALAARRRRDPDRDLERGPDARSPDAPSPGA